MQTAMFTTMITSLANTIKSFGELTSGVDTTSVQNVADDIDRLVDMFLKTTLLNGSEGSSLAAAFSNIATISIKDFVQAFSKSYTQVASTISTFFKNLAEGVKGLSTNFAAVGLEYVNALAKGMLNGKNNLQTTVAALVALVSTSFKQMATKLIEVGADFSNGLAKGMASGLTTIDAVLVAIVKYIQSGLSSISTYSIGQNVIYGVVNGMNSLGTYLFWASASLANVIISAFKTQLRIASPSKAMSELGMYSVMGYSNGLDKFAYLAENAAVNVADSSIQALKGTLGKINNVLEDDLVSSPVITPVLDLSQIQNGVGSISSMMFGSGLGSIGLASSITGSDIDAMSNYDDTFVIKAIDDLGNRIDVMGSKMANLQVVLDSGALVGETSSQMNNAFGAMETQVRRGVM